MKNNWQTKKLGEICNLSTGGTPSRNKEEFFKDGKIKWLVSGDIHKKQIFDCEGRITEKGMHNSNAKYLPLNSVIIALNGQGKTRGTVAILRTKATCNQSLVSIYPKDLSVILPEYLYCNLDGRYEEIRKLTGDTGNDRRGLNIPIIRNIDIPLPPFPEQKRIVAILNEVFEGIAKAKQNAEKNLKNARGVFETILNKFFEKSADHWGKKRLEEVSKINYGYTEKASFEEVGPKFLRITDIQNNNVDWDDVPYCKCGQDDLPKYKLNNGDIVFARTGATTGKSFLLKDPPKSVFASYLIRLKILDYKDLLPEFVYYFFQTKAYWDKINAGVSGSAQGGFNASKLGAMSISLPPIYEQHNIITKFDELADQTKKLEQIYQRKLELLEELKQSVLKKAFAGGL